MRKSVLIWLNNNALFLQLNDHDLEQFYTNAVVWNGDRERGATFLSERKVEGSYLIRDGTLPGSKVTLLSKITRCVIQFINPATSKTAW